MLRSLEVIASDDADSDDGENDEKPVKKESTDSSDDEEAYSTDSPAQRNMAIQQPQPRRKRFVPKYEVDGVHKVVLSEETQIQIETVIGTHVNSQYPWKYICKEKILENIETNGESSEFYSIKDQIEAYSENMILMGYIVDETTDVEEFYICCTKDARDHCKQQSDKYIRRQEKKLEKAVQKKPRPWKSLGSEKEIKELTPINTRPLLEVEIKTKFPREYQPQKFKIRDTNSVRDGYIELTPYRQKFNNVYSKRVDCAAQVAPVKVDRVAQTVLRYPQNMWTQSIADALGKVGDIDAGGDAGMAQKKEKQDEESSEEDEEKCKEDVDEIGLQAYRTALRRMRRPSYINMINNFMSSKWDEMNSMIELNTVMDMYCNDYPNLIIEKTADVFDSMTFEEYICFTDRRAKDKYISCAVFHPMWSGIVAISYADGSPIVMKSLGTRPDPVQRAVYGMNPVLIWSHVDSLIPKLYMESPREVKTLSFCPFNENILLGGCINGQIVVWDITNKLDNIEQVEVLSETREKYRIAMNAHMDWMKNVRNDAVIAPTALSNLITSHYGPVGAIKWFSPNFVVSQTGILGMSPIQTSMFFSGSEDGNILIWSLSIENISSFDGKKIKKSKRVPRRPSGLTVNVSPLKILDGNLKPCFKIICGFAGQPQTFILQSFDMDAPSLDFMYNPQNTGRGRKYFQCQIKPQTENDISSILYCGSQHGEVQQITWEGHQFNTGEVVNSEYYELKFSCSIHDGIISCTQKNPFLKHLTLTVGGKIFAIWSDRLLGRPLIWKKRPYRLTDGAWSLYKPSLLFISTAEGGLETWDLLIRSDEPMSIQTLSGNMLTSVSLHTLPLTQNIIGVSDVNGSFRMFLNPPIFMIKNPIYEGRLEKMIERELKVMQSFIIWQDAWMKSNPEILLEMKRKEIALLAEKDEEKRRMKEEEEKRLEEEAEKRRLLRMKVIGPEERWQKIIQKLIERTIAVKKRINRAELIEQEKPLRELEAQRLEKERRMLDIMKNQNNIFNDSVGILFPEAITKPEKVKKCLLTDNKELIKKVYIDDYENTRKTASAMVKDNLYKIAFDWTSTLDEGKERRQALNPYEDYIQIHKSRLEDEGYGPDKKKQDEVKPKSEATEEDFGVS